MATANRALPSKVASGLQLDLRSDNYGNLLTEPFTSPQQACDEGTYFVAVNATDNTAITASIANAFSATASGFIAIRNNDANADAGSGKRIILDYIKLILKTVPASSTDWRAVLDIDNVQSHFTSGGTAVTGVPSNMGSNASSIALVNVGALTTVALSSAGRTLGRSILRTQIPVTLDQTIFTFGGVDKPSNVASNGTGATNITVNFPPVVLTQNACMVLYLWGSSNASTAATYQFEMGWMER